MFKPQKSINELKHQEETSPSFFNIICWNLAKHSFPKVYKEHLQKLIQDENINVLFLQEVKKIRNRHLDIPEFSYVLSPNIQTKKHVYGILSAFKMSCTYEDTSLTKAQEFSYLTHKVSLITKHKLENGSTLLMLNLHAINFVKSKDFINELLDIKLKIQEHEGPVLVGGDFNTWNKKRVQALKDFAKELYLLEVEFSKDEKIKKFFTHVLDYVFYRGFTLHSSKVLDSGSLSDHNALMVKFKLV